MFTFVIFIEFSHWNTIWKKNEQDKDGDDPRTIHGVTDEGILQTTKECVMLKVIRKKHFPHSKSFLVDEIKYVTKTTYEREGL